MNSHQIPRRTFFRGATLGAGAIYLAPLLRDLQAAEKGSKPARVLFFVQGNGIYPDEIQPNGIERPKSPTNLEDRSLSGIEMADSLKPLAPWQDKMTLINGLSGRIALGSHNMGFAALGCWPKNKMAYGETIDAALARNLPGVFSHIGVGVSEKYGAIGYNLTSAGPGKALPTIMEPALAKKHFFSAGAEGESRKAFDVDTDLFEFMADDVKRMQVRLDGSEKEKLDRYLEAFEGMQARQTKLASIGSQIAKSTPVLDPKATQPLNFKPSKPGPTGVFDKLEAQFDIAVSSFIAGLSNVATVSACAGPDRIGITCHSSEIFEGNNGGMINAHGIGHGRYTRFAGKLGPECHAAIRRKCMEKMAGAIKKLESIPEGSGTMMDNTLIVYLSDAADQHHPGCYEWPFVLIGDLGGRLKLGNRYLRYPAYGQSAHRTTANLYLSLLHAVGERRSVFGVKDSGILDLNQDGPLAEILA